MRKWKKRSTNGTTDDTERDAFRIVAGSAEEISARYQDALAHLEETVLPDELKKSVAEELAGILAREIAALCEGGAPLEQSIDEKQNTKISLPSKAASATVAAIVAQAERGGAQ